MASNSFSPSKSFHRTPAACFPPLKPPAKNAPSAGLIFLVGFNQTAVTGAAIVPQNPNVPQGSPVQVQAWNNLGWTDLPTAVPNMQGDTSQHFPYYFGPGTATINLKYTYINGQVEYWYQSLTGPPFTP